MPPRDVLIATAVAVVGGLTFIAIKVGLAETPPRAPIVGVLGGRVVCFSEPLRVFELWGAVLVMAGLSVNVFGDRRRVLRFDAVG